MLEIYTIYAVPICFASLMPIVAWIVWIIAPIYFSIRSKNL